MIERGEGGHGHVGDLDLVCFGQQAACERFGFGRGPVGSEAVVDGQHGAVGHDVVGHAPLHDHSLHTLLEAAPVDLDLTGDIRGDALQDRRQPVDGVPSHPGSGCVRPFPGEGGDEPHRSLAAGLDESGRGLGEDGSVALEQVWPFAEEALDAVVAGRHLLALVEDVRDRECRPFDGARQLGKHGHARLHVRRSQTPEHVPLDAGSFVPVRRDGVGVAGQQQPRAAAFRARHQVVPHAVHIEPRHWPQQLLEAVGDGSFVVADRRDVDELGGERQEICQPTFTPVSRRISLR